MYVREVARWHVSSDANPLVVTVGDARPRKGDGRSPQAAIARYSAAGNRAISGLVTGPVLQREVADKLARGRLNVVGERHPESDPRRTFEEMLALEFDMEYWKEPDFSVPNQPPADLAPLRIAQAVGFLLPEVSRIERMQEVGWWRRRNRDIVLKKIVAYAKMIQTDGVVLKAWRHRDPPWEYAAHAAADEVVEVISSLRAVAEPQLGMVWRPGSPRIDWNVGKLAEAAKGLRDWLEFAAEDRSDSVALSRSRAMHSAAATPGSPPGIWKVGDAHAEDMEKFQPSPNYRLVRRANFNANYGQELVSKEVTLKAGRRR